MKYSKHGKTIKSLKLRNLIKLGNIMKLSKVDKV